MSAVAVIYLVRKALSPRALSLYALALSAAGVVAFVSVGSVLHNLFTVAAGGPANIAVFIISAVAGTTLLVQLSLFVGAFATGALVLDLARIAPLRGLRA
jgi:hypothetical protein